jgi:hypothetical protein
MLRKLHAVAQEGHVVSGEVVLQRADADEMASRLARISEYASALGSRIYNLVVKPVPKLEG